jgi:CDP-diacylglycerol---serine O-phosphatidyltransferase
MIKVEKHIPNLLTLTNLFFGFYGILCALQGYYALAAVMIIGGAICDLLDGLTARLFDAHSETGKQLDAFADLVTFGILPAIILHFLFLDSRENWVYSLWLGPVPLFSLLPFLLVFFGAIRLAKFNNLSGKEEGFRGLPIPASGLLFGCIPLILHFGHMPFFSYFEIWDIQQWLRNPLYISIAILIISYLMVSDIRFFDFKFENYRFRENAKRYLMIIMALLLAFPFFFATVPLIITIYIILSVILHFTKPDPLKLKTEEEDTDF